MKADWTLILLISIFVTAKLTLKYEGRKKLTKAWKLLSMKDEPSDLAFWVYMLNGCASMTIL